MYTVEGVILPYIITRKTIGDINIEAIDKVASVVFTLCATNYS
jgi:hypothetical protein